MESRTTVCRMVSPSAKAVLHGNSAALLEARAPQILVNRGAAELLRSERAMGIHRAQQDLLRLQRIDVCPERHIERCTGALSPLRRIPPEIWLHIFQLYQQGCYCVPTNGRPEPYFDCHKMWILGHVCQYWRNLALDTRKLWSTLRFTPASPLAAVKTWLSRAKEAPLTITFTCPGHKASSPAECEIFKVLLSRRHYWRDVVLRMHGRVLQLVLAADSLGFPILERLHYTNMWDASAGLSNTFSVAPKLRDLGLFNVLHLGPAMLPWTQIEQYQGDNYDHENNHILTLAPNITRIVLTSDGDDSRDLVHHGVKHLHFKLGYLVLARLTVPHLTSFRFSMTNNTGYRAQLQIIGALLTRADCVTELHIDEFNFTRLGIIDLFAATPALTSLTTVAPKGPPPRTTEAQDCIFAWLTPLNLRVIPGGAGTLPARLPKLRRLEAAGIQASDIFVRMVEARTEISDENVVLESVVLSELIVGAKEESQVAFRRLQELAKTATLPAITLHCAAHSRRRDAYSEAESS
ncbi:hypothetical protein C8R46DRAFT_1305475 [Mycena filopes]|nr:hypothetical protein C8R46DRAFT_1305475 [Mycena filopes]